MVPGELARRIAIDLTHLAPHGRNGGAGVVAAALIAEWSNLAPSTEFVILTVNTSHADLARLDSHNVRRVTWVFGHGVMPLYTPLSGSAGYGRVRPADHLPAGVEWTASTQCGGLDYLVGGHVAGWNATPTPFVWDGKRRERRIRAKQRRLGGSGAVANHQLIAAIPTS
jgi:hypothetical protein